MRPARSRGRRQRARVATDERAEVRLASLAAGGDAVGRLPDGLTVFVPMGAPGDLAEVRIVERHNRFARGEIARLLEPGPARRAPACDAFGRCGGCQWQHVDYAEQLRAKTRILRDALERIGGFALDADPPFTASPAELGYRGRARLLVEDRGVGYREARSHRLCAIRHCPVLAPALDAALAALADAPERSPGEWEISVGSDGSTRSTRIGVDGGDAEPDPARVVLRVGGTEVAISPGTFAQANALLLDDLHRSVLDAAGSGESALELHAGAGFFTLALAGRFARVIAVESNAIAIADLEHNLERAGLRGVTVVGARVADALEAWSGETPEVVVLDPPRLGLEPGDAARIAALAPRRIVYLSCDPATLARDARALAELGYALTGVRGLDLFPQTPHVEALIVLEPRP